MSAPATARQVERAKAWDRYAITASLALAILFLLGAAIHLVDINRPIDLPTWRECDVATIARNFYREGMNLFYPQIDWRREGPGYAEMELPLYPWGVAVLYRLFGPSEFLARFLSYLISLGAMAFFFQLARRLLPVGGALGAGAFWAMSPLVVFASRAIQPEGLMLFGYVAAVYAFVRWLDTESWPWFIAWTAATALAILGKAPAAHIGILFAILIYQEKGFGEIKRFRLWLFGAGALLPPVLWYAHAHGFWKTYGISLGLSNEYHWVGPDFFTNPRFIGGLFAIELWYVWTVPALLVVAYGLWRRPQHRVVRLSLAWLVAIAVYYVLASRTLSSLWASYYHVVAAPPAALLFGHGIVELRRHEIPAFRLFWIALASGIAAFTGWRLAEELAEQFAGRLAPRMVGQPFPLPVMLALLVAAVALTLFLFWKRPQVGATRSNIFTMWAVAAICPTFALQAGVIAAEARIDVGRDLYESVPELRRHIEPNARIATTGGVCIGPTGRPSASDAPYMYYWLDRKGFSICREKQSLQSVRDVAAKGVNYLVAEKDAVSHAAGFEDDLKRTFPLVTETQKIWLFRLN